MQVKGTFPLTLVVRPSFCSDSVTDKSRRAFWFGLDVVVNQNDCYFTITHQHISKSGYFIPLMLLFWCFIVHTSQTPERRWRGPFVVLLDPETICIQLPSRPGRGSLACEDAGLPPTREPKEKVFFQFVQWWGVDDRTTAPDPGLWRESFSSREVETGNQWSDQMMDPVISWFSDVSNNHLPAFSKRSSRPLNPTCYPLPFVSSTSGFVWR